MLNLGISFPKAVQVTLPNGKKNSHGQNQQQQIMYKGASGQVTTREQAFLAFEGKVQAQNNGIIAHEEAHRAGAGPQAVGSPHYNIVNFNGQTLITGGHQNVAMPAMVGFKATKTQIEKSIRDAEYTIAGAEAPSGLGGKAGELSAADRSVASRGRAILSAAKLAFSRRGDIESKTARTNEPPPQGIFASQQVAKSQQPKHNSRTSATVGSKLNITV